MANFRIGEQALYVVSRGSVPPPFGPFLHVGAVVRILFHGNYERGDTIEVGGSLRFLLQPADYIICDCDEPDIIAGVRHWQLAKYGDPDRAEKRGRERHHHV